MRTVTLLWRAIAKDRSLQREEWQGMHSLAIPRLVEKALLLMRNAYRILLGYSIHAISSLYILCWRRQFSMLWFGCIACLLFRSRFDIWILLWIALRTNDLEDAKFSSLQVPVVPGMTLCPFGSTQRSPSVRNSDRWQACWILPSLDAFAECGVGRALSVSQIWIKVAFFGGVVEASVSGKASL